MSTNKKAATPESVGDAERSRLDDNAVSDALSGSASPESGAKSVLPGPPIPPEVQAEIRDKKQPSGRVK